MDYHTDTPDRSTEILIGFGLLGVTLVIMCLGVLLIWFATLRENQMFWTNAGGYPIFLRDLVKVSYLPLFWGSTIVMLGLSMACFSKICSSLRFFVLELLLLVVCWCLLATSGFIALRNNVLNIIHGREMHYHSAPGK